VIVCGCTQVAIFHISEIMALDIGFAPKVYENGEKPPFLRLLNDQDGCESPELLHFSFIPETERAAGFPAAR
jgi:hypothetical protein